MVRSLAGAEKAPGEGPTLPRGTSGLGVAARYGADAVAPSPVAEMLNVPAEVLGVY